LPLVRPRAGTSRAAACTSAPSATATTLTTACTSTPATPTRSSASARARDPTQPRPRSWTFVCAAAGASFRLDGDDAEFGALTIQPSSILHGTPRVRGAAARAANAAAGLLGVAGFAKAAALNIKLPEAATRGARPAAAAAAEEGEGHGEQRGAGASNDAGRGRGAKRLRGE